jgi:peptidoglycan/xylan/chitin deacetylase (PgdA/CDA1 family)
MKMETVSNPIPIIYYHSVALKKNSRWVKNYLTLELKYFEDQMEFLKRNNFHSIFLKDYYLYKNGDIKLPKNTVCVTFDDGFLDNWVYAFPILKKFNIKATIFVSVDFVDKKNDVRKNLEDYWQGKATIEEINNWGYLSWEEMRLMEDSGLIDIQSHSMTHTKYFVSDQLISYHYPGNRLIEFIWNLYPEKKPYYIEDAGFEQLVPYGYPIFEQASSIIAHKIDINHDLVKEILIINKKVNWQTNSKLNIPSQSLLSLIKSYQDKDSIIEKRETRGEYMSRARWELENSKKIIEKNLSKQVEFCCWPNGDYNDFSHELAKEVGYLATTNVIKPGDVGLKDRFDRFGLYNVKDNRFLTKLKTKYKIRSYQKIHPYYGIQNIYNRIKYKNSYKII